MKSHPGVDFFAKKLWYSVSGNHGKGSDCMKQFTQNGKIGFMDSRGQVILEAQFDAVDTFYDPDYWHMDYGELCQGGHAGAGYEIGVLKDGKWGLIHRWIGQWITPCTWEAVGYFRYGLAKVKWCGKWGLIDCTGTVIVYCRWDDVHVFSRGGMIRVKRDGKYGCMDSRGEELLSCEWDAVAFHHNEKCMMVKRDGKWYLRDGEGNLLAPGEGKGNLVFHQGLAVINDGFGYGLIDREGEEVIGCQWDEIERVARNIGGIPWKRNEFIRLWYNRTAYPYSLIRVRKHGKWGVYDLKGKQCHPCTLDKIWRSQNGVIKICQEGKWGLMDEQGRIITPCQWEYVDDFRGETAAVRQNKHWGTIDRKGNLVHPCTHFVGLWRDE